MSKGTSSVVDYLRSIKMIAGELSLIGYPLDDINLVRYCLSGLGPSFKDIATVLHAHPSSFIYDQIYEHLVNHELHLNQENQPLEGPITTNHVHKCPSGSPASHHSSPSPHIPSSQHPNICQWCNKRGHTVCFCFKIANNSNVKPHANAITISSRQNHWLLDSGAFHHITNDFSNHSLHHEYPGTSYLTIIDGNTLPISHVSSATLQSLISSL